MKSRKKDNDSIVQFKQVHIKKTYIEYKNAISTTQYCDVEFKTTIRRSAHVANLFLNLERRLTPF